MGELVLLENELVNIYEGKNKEQIVSGRELHEFLESNERYSKWFNRMLTYGFMEDVDFTSGQKSTLVNNGAERLIDEHYLKMDMAKEIAMIQRNEKGKQARQYFIAAEKKHREQNNQQPLTMEDLIIYNAQMLKETRLKQEEHDRQLKLQQIQIQQNENKVVKMTEYITEAPDFKAVEHAINKYARKHNTSHSNVRADVYKRISDIYGINIKQRVKNAQNKLQQERVEMKKKPYSDNTLNSKVNGMTIIRDEKLESKIIEILMGMESEK